MNPRSPWPHSASEGSDIQLEQTAFGGLQYLTKRMYITLLYLLENPSGLDRRTSLSEDESTIVNTRFYSIFKSLQPQQNSTSTRLYLYIIANRVSQHMKLRNDVELDNWRTPNKLVSTSMKKEELARFYLY